MGDKPTVLAVQGLKKSIRGKEIIKGITFDVQEGEVFGFLGPNGAGKTTTIRMLVNLIRPTEGTITVCGLSVQREPEKALSHIGCIVENPEMYGYMSGLENLEHFARMFSDVGEDRIREVVKIVGLDARIRDKVKTYSLGMRQRLGIAQALLGRPKLLILDEPTNGLDPQGIKEMREFIRELASTGLSVFVSSHLLSEIQLMCDRVAIISHGEVIAVGDVDELLHENGNRVVWQAEPLERALPFFSAYLEDSSGHSVGQASGEDGSAREIAVRMPFDQIPEMTRRLVAAGVDVFSITVKTPTLEELFLQLTEGETIG
ncbi:ABC transporter ATP-binding protein [Gorillibacterium timonense]|uniref:ABC transporter ATP-binding protein n=1 Tax=Gorillibacterium timonense TaxID=1689269 RepID=UPI00071CCC90|nr:ABC transporter ATP-binding protein [Gorillibacterium timonense]